MKNPTMTLTECVEEMRNYGIRCSPMEVGDCIENGTYPFGRVKSKAGMRRSFEIWRVDFERWLENGGGNNAAKSRGEKESYEEAFREWRDAGQKLLQCQTEVQNALTAFLDASEALHAMKGVKIE